MQMLEYDSNNIFDDEDSNQSDENSMSLDIENLPTIKLNFTPTVAVPEKIVIVLDTFSDYSEGNLLNSLKSCISLFINLKTTINEDHEYALVTLDKTSPKWQRNFTVSKTMNMSLNFVQRTLSALSDELDLDATFDLIKEKVQAYLPEKDEMHPENIVRVLFIYSRSTVPTLTEIPQLPPGMFFDSLWLDDPEAENSDVEKLVKRFSKEYAHSKHMYVKPNSVAQLQNVFARFLAHPLQRALNNKTEKCIVQK